MFVRYSVCEFMTPLKQNTRYMEPTGRSAFRAVDCHFRWYFLQKATVIIVIKLEIVLRRQWTGQEEAIKLLGPI
jgi:hypothetical protein